MPQLFRRLLWLVVGLVAAGVSAAWLLLRKGLCRPRRCMRGAWRQLPLVGSALTALLEPRATSVVDVDAPPPAQELVATDGAECEAGVHRFADLRATRGIRLHYVESRPPKGSRGRDKRPVMLFLHGFPEFWVTWKAQLAEFGDDYRCVAVDMRGFGASDRPYSGGWWRAYAAYGADELVADIYSLLVNGLGLRSAGLPAKAVLVGHDWGGIVAWWMAHRHPDLISQLVIMNSPHPVLFWRNMSAAQARRSAYIAMFQAPLIGEMLMSVFSYASLGSIFHPLVEAGKMSREDVGVRQWAISRPGGMQCVLAYYRALLQCEPSAQMEAAMARPIDLPVLLLWGLRDKALGRTLTVGTGSVVTEGNLTTKYLKECGHFTPVDGAAEVNTEMRAWLREQRGK